MVCLKWGRPSRPDPERFDINAAQLRTAALNIPELLHCLVCTVCRMYCQSTTSCKTPAAACFLRKVNSLVGYMPSGCVVNMQNISGCWQARRPELVLLQDCSLRQAHRRQPGSMQASGREGPGDADQAATDALAITRRTLFMSAAGSALVPASEPAAQASDQITGLAVASTPGAAHVAAGQAAIAGKGMTAVRDPAIYRCLVHRKMVCHLPVAPAFIATQNCSKWAQACVSPAAGV